MRQRLGASELIFFKALLILVEPRNAYFFGHLSLKIFLSNAYIDFKEQYFMLHIGQFRYSGWIY